MAKVKVSSFHNGGALMEMSGVSTVADVASNLDLSIQDISVTVGDTPATPHTSLENGNLVIFQRDKHTSGK